MAKFFCYLCKQPYNFKERVPKILPSCGHTYCVDCLQTHFNPQQKTFQCIIDQILLRGERENLLNIPNNEALLKLIRDTKQTNTLQQDQQINKSILCVKHLKEKEIICLTDMKYICTDCVLFGVHSNHDYVRNIDFLQDCRSASSQVQEEILKLKNQMKKRECEEMLRIAREKHFKKIYNFKEKIIKQITDIYLKLENEFNQYFDNEQEKIEVVNTQQNELQKSLNQQEKTLKDFNSLIQIEGVNFDEIISLFKDIQGIKKKLIKIEKKNLQNQKTMNSLQENLNEFSFEYQEKDINEVEEFINLKIPHFQRENTCLKDITSAFQFNENQNFKKKTQKEFIYQENSDFSLNSEEKSVDFNVESTMNFNDNSLKNFIASRPSVNLERNSENFRANKSQLFFPQVENQVKTPSKNFLNKKCRNQLGSISNRLMLSQILFQNENSYENSRGEIFQSNSQNISDINLPKPVRKNSDVLFKKSCTKPSFIKPSLKQTQKKTNKIKLTQTLKKIQEINFGNQNLFDHDLRRVAQKVLASQTVKVLKLSNNNLTVNGFQTLLTLLHEHSSLQKIDLTGNFLDISVFQTLMKNSSNLKILKIFDFSQNKRMNNGPKEKNFVDKLKCLGINITVQ